MLKYILEYLYENTPVLWDRYTLNDDSHFCLFGWFPRSDGQRDFLVVYGYDNNMDMNSLYYTTSSAKHTKEIQRLIYGSDEDHSDCIPINKLFVP